ncbi:unnamed protein product [Cyclocybe aegerita]|uniref:F-box domain-containing protein n=1 Tax=Cyclocybe aegerita TaxID=1973307 RepID=A0A8S0XSE8_CYCAE|nr:unnamed protein product [Cyclocybe aegerita]
MPPFKKTERHDTGDYSEECQDGTQVHENPCPKLEDNTSAVRQAPIEILSEIFEYFVPFYSFSDDHACTRTDAPTPLMLTCRAWNNAVFATPGFWTTIPTIEMWTTRSRSTPFIQLLQIYLDRSKGRPIDVSIWNRPWKDVGGPAPPHPAVLLIVSESARWRRATISINAMSVNLLSGIKGRIPLLRTLRFSIQTRPSFRSMQEVFQTTPALVDLEVRTSRAFEFVDIPRTFTRFRGLVKDLQFFEASCAHITAITLKGPLQRIALPSQALTLPRLLSLSLINERFPYPADSANRSILSFLSAPRLQALEIHGKRLSADFILMGFVHLQLRSWMKSRIPSTLQSLSMDISISDNAWIPVLAFLPALKTFSTHPPRNDVVNALFRHSLSSAVQKSRHQSIKECFEAQEQGECSWKEMLSHPEGVEESKKLTGWHRVIAKRFLIRDPKESVRSYALTGKRRSWVKALADDMNRLDIFLKHIESYEIVDVNSLNTSRLHRSMRDLSLMPDGIIPQDDVYHFRERAKALVKRWFDLLSPLVNERQWIVTENATELEYVGRIPADKRDPIQIVFH